MLQQDASPTITVVIPHLNQPEMLRSCLQSLEEGTHQPTEIIVVDNGSSEMPDIICSEFADVTLLREQTPGPGPARNLGVANAQSDICAFIDADCLADSDWLEAVVRKACTGDFEILGGDVRIAYVDSRNLTSLEAYESVYAYRMDRYIAREGFTGTGNLVVKRDVLERVGPFAGIDVAEDRDWGHRATAMGYKIHYMPDMKVYHPARKSFTELKVKWDRHMSHDFGQIEGGKEWLKWTAKTFVMGVSPLFEIPRLSFSDRLSGAPNRLKAFKALTRIRLYRAKRMIQLTAGMDPNALVEGWNKKSDNP